MLKFNSKTNLLIKKPFTLGFIVVLFLAFCFGLFTSRANAQDSYDYEQITNSYVGDNINKAEHIKNFIIQVDIDQKGNLLIKEEITHVKNEPHHGIFRDIPISSIKYKGIKLTNDIGIKTVAILDENTNSLNPVKYEKTKESGNVKLKIGDPSVFITGEHKYFIEYSVKNGITYFDDHDELYWNIVGTAWQMPIEQVNFIINSKASTTDKLCFTGAYGAKTQNCNFISEENNSLIGESTAKLVAGEGLTVVLAYPSGTFEKPSETMLFLKMFLYILPLLLIPLVWLLIHIIWLKFGNDPEPKGVHPQYEPDKDLDPLIGGYIVKQGFDNKYISAYIIDLAVRGYITIQKISKENVNVISQSLKVDYVNPNNNKTIDNSLLTNKDSASQEKLMKQMGNLLGLNKDNFILHRTDKELVNPKPYETILLAGLFLGGDTSNLNGLKNEFYTTVASVSSSVTSYATDNGYLYKFGNIIRDGSKILIGLLFFAIFFIGPALFSMLAFLSASPLWVVFFVAITVIGFLYARSMAKRTDLGMRKYEYLLGMKMYIETAEIDKIKFHNDPEKYGGQFEHLLPYAMIFGLEKKWADKFKDFYTTPPSWYTGDNWSTFNAYILASSLSDSFSSTVSAASVSPRSSGGSGFGGGGFSGGGGGGGGGGSW